MCKCKKNDLRFLALRKLCVSSDLGMFSLQSPSIQPDVFEKDKSN